MKEQYIIRASTKENQRGTFYQSPLAWTTDIQLATIFMDFEIAEVHKEAAWLASSKLSDLKGIYMDVIPYSPGKRR